MEKTIQALKEKREGLLGTVQAMIDLATAEQRDLTDEENAELDDITEKQVVAIDAKLDRYSKIEALKAKTAAERAAPTLTTIDDGVIPYARISIPAKCRKASVRSFIGPEAEKDAFIAGNFYAAAIFGSQQCKDRLAQYGIQVAHSTTDNSKGGYLVPDPVEPSIIRLVESYGVARQNCRVVQMSDGTMNIPRRASGFTTYYVGENAAPTASDMAFDQVRLEAKKVAALTQVSSELSEDSVIALGDLLTQEFAFSIALAEDQALFLGDGTATYGGIVGLKSAVAAGSKQTGGANLDTFGEVVIGEFESAIGKLKQIPGIMPKWFIHSSGWANSMQRLANAAGGNTTQNIMGGVGPSFLGYPVVFSQVLPSGGSATDLSNEYFAYFGDLSMAATMGVRRGLTVKSSAEKYFAEDALAVMVTQRYDINVHERGDGSNGGPVIALIMGS